MARRPLKEAQTDATPEQREVAARTIEKAARPLDSLVYEDVDRLWMRVRDRLASPVQIAIGSPGPVADLFCVAWQREGHVRRAAFCLSVRECLEHVLEYEDRVDREGEAKAEMWQRGQRVRSEAEAARELAERRR